jgi:hypothetical protein
LVHQLLSTLHLVTHRARPTRGCPFPIPNLRIGNATTGSSLHENGSPCIAFGSARPECSPGERRVPRIANTPLARECAGGAAAAPRPQGRQRTSQVSVPRRATRAPDQPLGGDPTGDPCESPALVGDPTGATRAMAAPLPLPATEEQKRRSGDVDWATAVMQAGGRDLLWGTKLQPYAR